MQRNSLHTERLKKFGGRLGRGFLASGEALAKEHVRRDLRLSQNEPRSQKDRRSLFHPNGFRISLTALSDYFRLHSDAVVEIGRQISI